MKRWRGARLLRSFSTRKLSSTYWTTTMCSSLENKNNAVVFLPHSLLDRCFMTTVIAKPDSSLKTSAVDYPVTTIKDWNKRTREILRSDVDDSSIFMEDAYHCLEYWLSRDTPNQEAARYSIQLVHWMSSNNKTSSFVITSTHWNRLVYHYYIISKILKTKSRLPSAIQILADINRLTEQSDDPNNHIDLKTYNMLMDGARLVGKPRDVQHLLQQLQHDKHLQADLVSYNMAISAWIGRLDGPTQAQALFDELVQDNNLQPDEMSYGALMAAYAQAGNAAQVQTILKEMRQSNLQPNIQQYGALLDGLAKSGQAVQAEQVLTDMETVDGILPNSICYDTVLAAYNRTMTNQSNPDTPFRMERILETMKHHYQQGQKDCRPTKYSYGVTVAAWSKSSRADAPQRARALVHEMMQQSDDLQPDVAVYNSLLSAHGRGRDIQGALQVWKHIKHEYATGKNVAAKPNWMSYNIMMDAWSKSQRVDATEQAEALLDEMKRLLANGDGSVKPTNSTYTALMTVWTRSGGSKSKQRAAERCQELFEELIHRYEQSMDDPDLRPNYLTYGALLTAWSHARQPERAEDVLRYMITDYGNGNKDAKPTTDAFNNVLSAWARSERRDGPDRAQVLLHKMRELYNKDGWNTKPNSASYASLLACWAYSNKPGAAQKAEGLFRDFQAQGDVAVSRQWYTSLMTAWARSRDPQAPERIQALFDDMKRRYKQGDTQLKPNSACYTPLLAFLSRQQDAHVKAQAVFDEMVAGWQAGDQDLRPTCVQYANLINSYAQGGHAEEAERILHSMYEEVSSGRNPDAIPNKHSFGSVLVAYTKSNLADAPERAQDVLNRMMEDFSLGVVKDAPGEAHFGMLISVWTRSKRPEAGEEAEKILHQMEDLAETKEWDCYPGLNSYSAAMRAWNDSGRPDSFQRSEALFVKLVNLANENKIRLDNRVFSLLLHGLARSDIVDKRTKLQSSIQLMELMNIDPDNAIQEQVRRMLDSPEFQ